MRYAYLTGGWAGCILVSAIAGESTVVKAASPLMFTGLVVAGVVGMSGVRRRLWISGMLGGAWLASLWLAHMLAHPIVTATMAIVGVVFIGAVAVAIIGDFLRAQEIRGDILWGAIGVYLLIATAFGLVFLAIETTTPGAITGSMDDKSYIYFSLVTMTTLGYGDIVPVSDVARVVASFTAICGVMYTAVIISRLVALEITSSIKRNP